jgi:sialic acid synthase
MDAGEIITENDLHLLSPGDGFKWAAKNLIIGKKALTAIPANEIIYPEMIG